MVTSAREVGAEALQTFASNPRAWATPRLDRDALEETARAVTDGGLGPVFVHASYLVNIASPSPEFLAKSAANLAATVAYAEPLEAGVVVHAGAAGNLERAEALRRVRRSLMPLLEDAGVDVLVELTSGGSGSIASTWPQAGELLDALDGHDRLRFCFDTCHAFAAGYELSNEAGLRACLDEMRRTVGLERLRLLHANDSKDPRGSRRDRHEHLGRGTIGEGGFRALMASEVANTVPIVVETPPKGQAADIALLRRVADS